MTIINDDWLSGVEAEASEEMESGRHMATLAPCDVVALVAAHRSSLARIAELEAQVSKYQARLEIDHCFDLAGNRVEIPVDDRDCFPDKIDCQEADIGVLEQRIAELEVAASAPASPAADLMERMAKALRENFCPRPCNSRPDDFSVGQCVDAGECGCGNRAVLADYNAMKAENKQGAHHE